MAIIWGEFSHSFGIVPTLSIAVRQAPGWRGPDDEKIFAEPTFCHYCCSAPPNSILAGTAIDDLSARSKILNDPVIRLDLESTPDQIRAVLAGIRLLLETYVDVQSAGAREACGIRSRRGLGWQRLLLPWEWPCHNGRSWRKIGRKCLRSLSLNR